MEKVLVLDMDGTIVDLYGVKDWLEDLKSENTRPYDIAKPIYDMDILNALLNELRECGWKIVITTWLAKDSSKLYDDLVRIAKINWLKRYNFTYDEIHLIKYGTTKANATRKLGGFQILVDDNEKIRKGWKLGATINANKDIIEKLVELLD